jgi:hypothetical protein
VPPLSTGVRWTGVRSTGVRSTGVRSTGHLLTRESGSGLLCVVQPAAYEEADDEVLVLGCSRGDAEAVEVLVARHGMLAELAVLRELEEGAPRDLSGWLSAKLRAEPERLSGFVPGASSLRAYLAVIARQRARPDKALRRHDLVSALPTPGPIDLAVARESLSATSLMQAAKEAIARQPPNVLAVLRMRFFGLSRSHIAALLGTSEAQTLSTLERVAARLGALETEMQPEHLEGEHDDLTLAFRALLDASPPGERVRFARRTESERPLARLRAQVDMAYRWLKDQQLGLRVGETGQPGPHCLSASSIAGYADGSTRGAQRARAEGHLSGCSHCLDEVAALSCDLRALPLVRDALSTDRSCQVAAMAIGTACFDAGTTLAESMAARRDGKSGRLASDLARLGRACRVLQGGAAHDREMSGLVQRDVPSDDEAPLVAFESLALGDSGAAFRAIDEANAPAPVAARVRVLAAAAGGDAPLGHAWARAVKDGYDVDPGAVEDAECVLALGEGEALPREIIVERLRALVPDLVRVVLAMHARPTR